MRKLLVILISTTLLNLSCQNEESADPYFIGKQNIGLLTDSTEVRELGDVYANDSIAKFKDGNKFTGASKDINVYSLQGEKLLTLSPTSSIDSTANIASIQIFDSKFRTGKNVSTVSTFKDIRDNYRISKIDNMINSIVVSVNEINATFTIDKKELPPNYRYNMNSTIEKSQIPDEAKIKFFMIHWN